MTLLPSYLGFLRQGLTASRLTLNLELAIQTTLVLKLVVSCLCLLIIAIIVSGHPPQIAYKIGL